MREWFTSKQSLLWRCLILTSVSLSGAQLWFLLGWGGWPSCYRSSERTNGTTHSPKTDFWHISPPSVTVFAVKTSSYDAQLKTQTRSFVHTQTCWQENIDDTSSTTFNFCCSVQKTLTQGLQVFIQSLLYARDEATDWTPAETSLFPRRPKYNRTPPPLHPSYIFAIGNSSNIYKR